MDHGRIEKLLSFMFVMPKFCWKDTTEELNIGYHSMRLIVCQHNHGLQQVLIVKMKRLE